LRLVDIYKETADGISLVTEGCIQTGETMLNIAPQSKFFTMADGSTTCYPAGTARQSMTLELECTAAQAGSIRAAMHLGSLLFAGVRFGTTGAAETTGYRAFPNGDAEIGQMFALSDLYRVRIPLLLDASGTGVNAESVPVLQGEITLGGETDALAHYRKTLRLVTSPYRNKVTVWERIAPVFTGSAALAFSLTVTRGDNGSVESLSCAIPGAENVAVSGGVVTATLPLSPRDNVFEVTATLSGCRPLRLRIPVYRQVSA